MRDHHARIAEFMKPGKRERYREMISNPRHRHKFTSILAHFAGFDPKYRLPIPSNKLFKDNIARELRKRHCPNIVYAISEYTALDDRDLPLDEALGEIVGRGIGTVLSCLRLGICWFKTGSTEHISRIWEMVNILERNGIYVKKIRTSRPVGL